jgi:hypothetical protein
MLLMGATQKINKEDLMSKQTYEKSSRRYIPASFTSDRNKPAPGMNFGFGMDWKTSAGLMVGAWALRRYPKLTLLSAVAAGAYFGLKAKNKGQNPFKGEGIVKNIEKVLH